MARRKIFLIVALVVLIALCGVGATLAFQSTYIERTNTVKIGNVDIETHTTQAEKPTKLIPGTAVDNENISITNKGSYDAYIRIEVIPPKGDWDEDLYNLSFRMKNGESARQIGKYYYLKAPLKAKSSPIELASTIALDSSVGQIQTDRVDAQGKPIEILVGPQAKDGSFKFDFKVEALQTDHIELIQSGELAGYPIWPDDKYIIDYEN